MSIDSRWRHEITGILALALFAGCGGSAASEEEAGDTFGQSEQALHRIAPIGISRPYMEVPLVFPAGVAGGDKVLFIGSPFEGRVAAFNRFNEQPLGDLPPPEQGFILPFILKSTDSQVVTVLDAGGFPSPVPFVPANPILYEYEYSYSARRGFSAELIRSIPFEGALVGFAEDAIRLDDGRYLVDDAILGSIWIAETDGSITPGIVPETFEPEDRIEEMAFCETMPLIEVGGVPFLFSGSTIPGIAGMAERDGVLYFSSACSGAVYSVPLAVFDDDREPHERAADIELVSSKPDGIEVEQLLGISFDPNRPDEPYLYAADSLQLRVIRINVVTGERRVVGDDPTLFNFPSSLGFLPPVTRHEVVSTMVVVSNQQHLTPITNGAITEDMFEPPFLATKVLIPKERRHRGHGHGHW